MNLDELYFKDNFTKENDKVNLNVNQLSVDCITSNNNKFSLDDEGNLAVKSITTEDNMSAGLTFNDIYPIGAIYISVSSINPSDLFGGTWEQIKDVFLLGCGNIFNAGSTGGEREHVLTINEIPPHQHFIRIATEYNGNSGNYRSAFATNSPWWIGDDFYDWNNKTNEVGSGWGHNNMPPYLSVYMWKRVA